MLEQFKEIEWDDYVAILSYGNPPVWLQLVIFTGLSGAYVLYRIMTRKRPMSKANKLKYKILFFVVILLILFQEEYNLRGLLDTIGL